ncbi:adenylate/guanylate cyclase domain-containing protein [Bradyrhizobium erythrophlei]|uniref:Adenylate cyclase n=1 Tax=Bradyrhizobium erythrophlei TaxID=1437360 RepID=A0A1M5UNU1_9BRAD|nr:adenylate/guanylate cyclase domain-containing protein [Bradyrhizobium erythrophlei]SHH64546.1 adenylate cyclase [Bradyrhizobium erythrophlei]
MPALWHSHEEKQRSAASAEFDHALTREVLRTELVRVRALIATAACLLVIFWTVDLMAPEALNHIWRGQFRPSYLNVILAPFILFELWVHAMLRRHLKLDRDVPVIRRYLGALIETSLPTIALAVHIQNMGEVQALGFVMPFAYFIFIILSTLRLDFWLSTFTGFVAAAELLAMAMFYHPLATTGPKPDITYHGARSLIILISGILAGAVGVQLRRQFAASIRAATARDRVTNLFGQHVSPQVVERLLAEGAEAASDIRRVAVMFVDFRSFTAGARSRSPQEVVERLDGAFAVLVEILDRHGGIVNKFLGDGFLALFGVPFETAEAAQHAVAAAREMLVAMDGINMADSWKLRIGIGIHFGEVVAGNIGSPRRKEYTVIGDTVNFAARLESLNKEFNSQLLISAAVRDALDQDGCDAVSLGEVAIKGYDRPMAVWQLG